MAKAIYDVQVPNIGEVERALGDMRDKAPRAMKNAVNQTATRAKNMMIRQARLRYAVNSAGRRHLNALKVRNRATTQNPTAEIFISSRRNDLGDFQSNPSVPHMGRDWVLSPEFHTSRVLKKSPMEAYTKAETDQRISAAVDAHNGAENAHSDIRASVAAMNASIKAIELKFGTNVTKNPFSATFGSLDGLTVTGAWNAEQARVEF